MTSFSHVLILHFLTNNFGKKELFWFQVDTCSSVSFILKECDYNDHILIYFSVLLLMDPWIAFNVLAIANGGTMDSMLSYWHVGDCL